MNMINLAHWYTDTLEQTEQGSSALTDVLVLRCEQFGLEWVRTRHEGVMV